MLAKTMEKKPTQRVHFDPNIDWEQEALRSVRGSDYRKELKELQKKRSQIQEQLAHRTATIVAVASILIQSKFSKRLSEACQKSRNLRAGIDAFLDAIEPKSTTSALSKSRQERCANLKRVHQNHGRRLVNWTDPSARDTMVQLSLDPTFSAEFSKELRYFLGSGSRTQQEEPPS